MPKVSHVSVFDLSMCFSVYPQCLLSMW